MATNQKYDEGDQFPLDVSAVNGSGVGDLIKSGDPGVQGDLPFVALTDEDAAGVATVKTNGVYHLAVRGHDGTANAAVGIGATVYWDNTNGELDVQVAGKPFGYALAAVASGATSTIPVKIGR